MFDAIKGYVSYGLQLFKDDPYLLMILLGILASWFVTQGVKTAAFPATWTDDEHRRATWFTSIISGTFFSFFFWHYKTSFGIGEGVKHDPAGFDFICALVVGFASPSLHWLCTRLLYWKWPQLETILSSRPSVAAVK